VEVKSGNKTWLFRGNTYFYKKNVKLKLNLKEEIIMLKENIAKILGTENVIVKKSRNDFVSGAITKTDNKKKSTFNLSWGDDYVYLRIKGNDTTLQKTISEMVGTKCIKGECGTWTGKEILYAWHKEEKEQSKFLKSLSFACGLNSGLFSFLGWQKVELIAA